MLLTSIIPLPEHFLGCRVSRFIHGGFGCVRETCSGNVVLLVAKVKASARILSGPAPLFEAPSIGDPPGPSGSWAWPFSDLGEHDAK